MTSPRQATLGSDGNVPIPPHYRLVGKISTSRTGVVYLCRHVDDGAITRPVAIKVVHAHLTEDPEFDAALVAELGCLDKLSHPNLVGIRELVEHDGRRCIVMPYIEGGSLAEIIAQSGQPLPIWFVVQVMIGVLNGLHAAHSAIGGTGAPFELVHGDVSPKNLYIDTYGNARVANYGFAKAASVVRDEPSFDSSRGVYPAPEYFLGGKVDRRADVFSAGAVLWTALTGKPLFAHPNAVVSPNVVPPSSVRTEMPRWFDSICHRALCVDPADRYQSAAEMGRAIYNAAAISPATGSSRQVGERVAEVFAKRIAHRREMVRDSRVTTPSPVATPGMTQGDLADEPSSPAIPAGIYFSDQFKADSRTGSWPFVDFPATAKPPSELTVLHPRVQARRRRYRTIGLALVVALVCVAGGLGLTWILRHDTAPERPAAGAVTVPGDHSRSPVPDEKLAPTLDGAERDAGEPADTGGIDG